MRTISEGTKPSIAGIYTWKLTECSWRWLQLHAYLHKRFRIITGPLLKTPSLREAMKPCEWRDCCYSRAMSVQDHYRTNWLYEYLLSISSKTWAATLFEWRALMYAVTHSTKWSLKHPLMSWWRMSGAISWWISARGKSFVNGYRLLVKIIWHDP